MERNERTAQQEAALQRWADDGGGPRVNPHAAAVLPRPRWEAVGVAVAVGFALGWLTGRGR